MKELEDDRQLARELGQPGAAVSAVGLKANKIDRVRELMNLVPV
jgi:hypothetical protein